MDMFEKLKILTDAAKYDVACTSSGSDRRGRQGVLGNAVAAGICHSFAADGRCISLLKAVSYTHLFRRRMPLSQADHRKDKNPPREPGRIFPACQINSSRP